MFLPLRWVTQLGDHDVRSTKEKRPLWRGRDVEDRQALIYRSCIQRIRPDLCLEAF